MNNARRLARARAALVSLGINPDRTVREVYDDLRQTKSGGYATFLGTNVYKAKLSEKRGVLTGIQYLSPSDEAGIEGFTLCHFASEGCGDGCINKTGQNVSSGALTARRKRTLRWFLDEERAAHDFYGEVLMLEGRAIRDNFMATVRADGTSDNRFWSKLPWWRDVRTKFYDYTKRPVTAAHLAAVRDGWHTTFSLSEDPKSMRRSLRWAEHGINTAIVVGGPIGSTTTVAKKVAAELIRRGEFAGRPTFDGDRDDLRWMDPAAGGWVVLSAKGGKAKRDESGFVVRFDPAVLLGTDWSPETALLSVFDRQRFNPSAAAAAAK